MKKKRSRGRPEVDYYNRKQTFCVRLSQWVIDEIEKRMPNAKKGEMTEKALIKTYELRRSEF